jgi:hypothetical protein
MSEECDCPLCPIQKWLDKYKDDDSERNRNLMIKFMTTPDNECRFNSNDFEYYNEIINDVGKVWWQIYNDLVDKDKLKQNKHYEYRYGRLFVDFKIKPAYVKGYRKYTMKFYNKD